MRSITAVRRRGLLATFAASAASAVAGAAVVALTVSSSPAMPSATAAPDPCAASEVARTIGSVATSTADYLDEHPQTNQALTTIAKQQGGPQSLGAVKTYFDANPQAAKDMQQLQQPLATLSGSVQTAADTAADDGSDAGRAAGAGGPEPSGEFARRPAQRAGCRLARRRVTDATGGGIAGFAGHRGASRRCDRRPALAWADAQPSLVGVLSCVFSLSRDSLAATQESRHTF